MNDLDLHILGFHIYMASVIDKWGAVAMAAYFAVVITWKVARR